MQRTLKQIRSNTFKKISTNFICHKYLTINTTGEIIPKHHVKRQGVKSYRCSGEKKKLINKMSGRGKWGKVKGKEKSH